MFDPILVHLHDVDGNTIDASVLPMKSVQVIEALTNVSFGGDNRVFLVYKGSVIAPAFSFNFYNIRDGDHIFIMRAQGQMRMIGECGAPAYRTGSNERREKNGCAALQRNGFASSYLKYHRARLMDIYQSEIENSKYCFSKAVAQLSCGVDGKGREDQEPTVEMPAKLDGPSTDTLPFLW